MSEEYDLKKSESAVGQLYPILVDKKGNIIDGFHREKADKNWKTLKLEHIDTEEKLLLARLIANFHRRQVSREEKGGWINGLAEIYQKQGFKVSGERRSNEIIDKIAEATGLAKRTIEELIASKFKQMEEGHGVPHETPILQKAEGALGEEGLKKLKKQILKEDKLSPQEKAALARKRAQEREERKRKAEEKKKKREEEIKRKAEQEARANLLEDKEFIKTVAKLAPQIKEEKKSELPFDVPSLDIQLDKVFSAMAKTNPHRKKKEENTDFIHYMRGYIQRKKIVCPVCGESHIKWSCGHEF